jgi:hypothetical protein
MSASLRTPFLQPSSARAAYIPSEVILPNARVPLTNGKIMQAMYQREAMWMSFEPEHRQDSYAVKVSVGGVNALTGLPPNQSVLGKQDETLTSTLKDNKNPSCM